MLLGSMHGKSRSLNFAIVALLVSTVILLTGSGATSSSAYYTKVPQQQSIQLFQGYYDYMEIDSFSNDTWIVYNVTSVYPISTALMNRDQLSSFANVSSDPISNSITYQNGTSVFEDIQIPIGQYFLVFYAYSHRTIVNFGYSVYPNTPFSYGAVSSPQPSGIVSYGINNDSGTVAPYEIQTNEIVGLANISSLLADNPNASFYGDHVAGATLQLNANLVVNLSNGFENVYWVQNTPDFVTSVDTISLVDNLWNNTDTAGVLSNESVTSTNAAKGAAVYTSVTHGATSYAYVFGENNATYLKPFSFALIENETVQSGVGVLVQFGFHPIQNGTLVSSPTTWYDNVSIHAPDVQSAHFDVAGNATTPIGNFYDAELVFAGEGNFETTQFVEMSASLGLFYQDQASGTLKSFPSFYSFGGDTGEAATNVFVSYSNGIGYLSVGSPNYAYLGNSALTLARDYRLPSQIFHTPNQTQSITPGTTETSTSQTQNATTVQVSAFSNLLLIAGVIVVILVVGIVAVLAIRRKPQELLPYLSSPVIQVSQRPCPCCATPLPSEALFCSNCGAPQPQT